MKYEVKYYDTVNPDDFVVEFDTEEEAEDFIKEDLEMWKGVFEKEHPELDYVYGTTGRTTEIWVRNTSINVECQWERLYK